jgi:hypothetical protein
VSTIRDDAGTVPREERLLWEGRPAWWPLAVRAFHVREVTIYFSLFMAWRFGSMIANGDTLVTATISALWLLVPAGASLATLLGLAVLYARTTRYRITSRRVLMEFGVALPITLNVPFRIVGAAALRVYEDGIGDIPLTLTGKERAAYLLLWPHVRPWRIARAEPMLRAVRDARRVADVLSNALIAGSDGQRPPVGSMFQASAEQAPRREAAVA